MPDTVMFGDEAQDEIQEGIEGQKKLMDAKQVGLHTHLGPIYMARDRLGVKTYFVVMPDGTKVYTPYGGKAVGIGADGKPRIRKYTIEERQDYTDVLNAAGKGMGLDEYIAWKAKQADNPAYHPANTVSKDVNNDFTRLTQPIVEKEGLQAVNLDTLGTIDETTYNPE